MFGESAAVGYVPARKRSAAEEKKQRRRDGFSDESVVETDKSDEDWARNIQDLIDPPDREVVDRVADEAVPGEEELGEEDDDAAEGEWVLP